jgi:hypothetical protein
MSARNLYHLLGARPEATLAELRDNYERALAGANRTGATKHMMELVSAYEVLSNPHARAYYDKTGRAVRPERVPGTFGRQVPFRPGPSVFRTTDVIPSAAGRCQPPEQRFGLTSSRGRWGALLLMAVIAAVSGVVVLLSPHRVAQPTVVPGAAGSQTLVICASSSYWASAGLTVTCADGAAPSWGGTRVR